MTENPTQPSMSQTTGETNSTRHPSGIEIRDEEPTEDTIVFRWSDDPFINEATAELGRQLANAGLVDIYPMRIVTAEGVDVEEITTYLRQVLERVLSRSHRRSAVAHQINAALEQMRYSSDDERWIGPPTEPFPNESDESQTIYSNDRVDVAQLKEFGIPVDEVEYVDEDTSRLYTLSPTYVGQPSQNDFQYQLDRFNRYLDTFLAALTGQFEGDDTACMICGSEQMPTTKGVEHDYLEFNQSFNILASASAVSTPLGMASRTTSHRGRCAACLVAGFYYTFMPKLVRYKDRETCGGSFPIPVYRIFTPRGDYDQLVGVRSDFENILVDIDAPTANASTRQETLEGTRTQSRGLQTLQFYETILRHVNTVYEGNPYDFSVQHRPTGLISYTSASKKIGRPNRDIREVETIDPSRWAYEAVAEQTIESGSGESPEQTVEFWPFADLLSWYAQIEDASVASLDDLGYGVLRQDLGRIERGLFDITKTLERTQGQAVDYVLPVRRAQNYFSFIMEQTTTPAEASIDDEAIQSIKRVASNLGGTFYQRDDISVLIGLQNASTSNEFLDAFEKASMQAQKKSSSEDGNTQNWSGRDDVAQVLQLINDPETFETAKRMFVIHASLSAQYMNAQRATESNKQ
jgi:hypothetical protein